MKTNNEVFYHLNKNISYLFIIEWHLLIRQ